MNKVRCLLYHRILPKELLKYDIYNIGISVEEFEKQIEYIVDNFSVGRFEADWRTQKPADVVITFDDGYRDNYLYALPILKKYNVPATIFVSTANVLNQKEMWWDQIAALLLEESTYKERFHLVDPLYEYSWETKTREQRLELALSLRWLLRMESDDNRFLNWMGQLIAWKGKTPEANEVNLLMNSKELKELSKEPLITLGAHTHTHHSLGFMSVEEQQKEIRDSISLLEEIVGERVEVFSYPFGTKSDYTIDTLSILEKEGIKKSATTKMKMWDEQDNDLVTPRISIKSCTLTEFKDLLL